MSGRGIPGREFFDFRYIKFAMATYGSFLRAVFGKRYAQYVPLLRTVHLYCLSVVTLVLSLCVYSLQGFREVCDRTFRERVHEMRVKYAAPRRPGYD